MYTVVVSGVSFSLSEASIRSDSPDTNLLAMSLLGDFAGAQDGTLVLNRNATTFKLIRDHMAGYTVSQLVAQDYPGMDKSKFMRNLRDDCDYYGLDNLNKALKRQAAIDAQSEAATPSLMQLKDKQERYRTKLGTYEMHLKACKQNIDSLKAVLSETTQDAARVPSYSPDRKVLDEVSQATLPSSHDALIYVDFSVALLFDVISQHQSSATTWPSVSLLLHSVGQRRSRSPQQYLLYALCISVVIGTACVSDPLAKPGQDNADKWSLATAPDVLRIKKTSRSLSSTYQIIFSALYSFLTSQPSPLARLHYHLNPLSVLFLSLTPTSDIRKMYKTIVSGVTFTLSEASIRSDSPDTNLLAMSLLGDFAEAEHRTLVLDRSAQTFKLVRDRLAGYTIFPLETEDREGLGQARLLRYL
jgi:hypothetical protein